METKTKNSFRGKQTRINNTKNSQVATKKTITVGTICQVEITALGPNSVGMASVSRNLAVFIPNTTLGEQVEIEITKLHSVTTKSKYAIGRKIKTLKQDAISVPNIVGTILQLQITKPGPLGSGQAEYNVGSVVYPILIPNAKVGNQYSILITRLKKQYGFGKIVTQTSTEGGDGNKVNGSTLKVGSSLTVTVPQNAPRYGKFVALKVQTNAQDSVVLVRLSLGAKAGQRVRVQITKTLNIKIQESGVVLAKVIKLAPLSSSILKLRTRQMVRQMVKNGLHFGDKTVKCQANMKKYLWASSTKATAGRPIVKNGRYFVNLLKTRQCLKQALKAVSKYAAKGRTFLFVGTSKISSSLIARAALFSKNFFVNTRWLGGMLTNWKTIVKSISKIRPILQQKQEIMTKILQKRQRIKHYFLSKLDKLNTKTKLLVQIGRTVLQRLQTTTQTTGANWVTFSLLTRSNLLMQKRQQLIEKAQILFTKRQQLLAKYELLEKTNQQLFTNVAQLQTKYTQLLTQYNLKRTKLRELKALLQVSVQLTQLAKQQGEQTFVGPYAQLTKYATNQESTNLAIVPNPPKDLFNKMIIAMRSQNEGTQSFVNPKNEKGTLVIFSKLLLKFSQSSAYLQTQIKTIYGELQQLATEITSTNTLLIQQKDLFTKRLQVKQLITKELTNVRTQLASEQKIVSIVKTKLMRLDAQRRLLSFIPRVKTLAVRYKAVGSMNPAESTAAKQNIQQTVQLVMRRLVDPKMKYSIDKIYDAKLRSKSKKTAAARKKKWQSLLKYFGGIANMTKLTRKQISNNVAVIVGQQENMNAVRECKKMGIKMLNIVDTNCNPALADHIIPANDDSRNSIKYVLTYLLTYIRLAQKLRARMQEVKTTTKRVQTVFKGALSPRNKKGRRVS